MPTPFSYTFPAIRGIQATHEYYVSMCPLRLIPKIFLFDEDELRPELRAQRVLNKARIPAMCDYLISNPGEYVFSAITASIDADVEFTPVSNDPAHYNVGHLHVPMTARFVINDGQHRRAAIEAALRLRPELNDETIAVVFFIDSGLARSQQMFADLNRYAIRPTQSLSILYDHRDDSAKLVRELVNRVTIFRDLTEFDKSTIPNRSTKLFTLSGVYRATRELLASHDGLDRKQLIDIAVPFWDTVADQIAVWWEVKRGAVSAAEVRKDYIHAHTVALAAIGRAGRTLLAEHPDDWRERLKELRSVDWRRSNAAQWEGRATVGGRVSIAGNHVTLMANEIKRVLGLPLTDEEEELESAMSPAIRS